MQWINTNEKMPDKEMRVLLYTPYQVLGSEHACIGNREAITACKTRKGRSKVPVFTHWMPLPEFPNEPGAAPDADGFPVAAMDD
jgi:hypothetical protein